MDNNNLFTLIYENWDTSNSQLEKIIIENIVGENIRLQGDTLPTVNIHPQTLDNIRTRGGISHLYAICYYHGLFDFPQYLPKAKDYFETSLIFNKENRNVINFLGSIYDSEFCDYTHAFELYNKAISLGDHEAMINLANMYEEGHYFEKNITKAIELYEQVIKVENGRTSTARRARFNLALLYVHTRGTDEEMNENYKKAVSLYEEAIKLGDYDSMNNLAGLYEEGKGVEQDFCKAVKLYNDAVIFGNNSPAMNNLALLYKEGLGVEKDREKAKLLLEKEIHNTQNERSYYNLACIHRDENDTIKSYELFFIAYEYGVEDAKTEMKNLELSPEEKRKIELHVKKMKKMIENKLTR